MKNIESSTIVRTIVLVIAVLNQVLTMAGKNPLPFSEDELYLGLTNVFTVAATIWGWWKNSSITPAAIQADEIMSAIKDGDVTVEEVKEFIEQTV